MTGCAREPLEPSGPQMPAPLPVVTNVFASGPAVSPEALRRTAGSSAARTTREDRPFASDVPVIPPRASFRGRRPCAVPNQRCDRPRDFVEYDGIISIPNSPIALPNCVGLALHTFPPAAGAQ